MVTNENYSPKQLEPIAKGSIPKKYESKIMAEVLEETIRNEQWSVKNRQKTFLSIFTNIIKENAEKA